MRTLEEIVTAYDPLTMPKEALLGALMEREDEIADALRMAGHNLGAMPPLTNKAIMDIGIGTPPSDDVRVYIDAEFATCVARVQAMMRGENPDNPN